MGLQKIDDTYTSFGTIIDFETATDLRDNLFSLDLVVAIGEIVPFLTGIPGVPDPDPNIYQECVGDEILNLSSPLRSIGAQRNFTPDLRDRYLRMPNVFAQSGQAGGFNDTLAFRHNHAGRTGVHVAPEDGDPSSNTPRAKSEHDHTIDYSFPNPVNVEPPYLTVKYYMRTQ